MSSIYKKVVLNRKEDPLSNKTIACVCMCVCAYKQEVIQLQKTLLSLNPLVSSSAGFNPQAQGPFWDSLESLKLSQIFQSTSDQTMLWLPPASRGHGVTRAAGVVQS